MKTLATLLLLACTSAPPVEPRPNPPDEQRVLAAEVVRLTTSSCGKCHIKSSPDAVPGALAVFDYERADWPSMLSVERLHSYHGRLQGKFDEAGQRSLDRFIQGELSLRKK
jgi:hypothetical protein